MPYTDLSWRLFRPAEGFYTSEVQAPRRLPIRTFLPVGYEPNYAYPLLVFFHGHGGNEEQILKLAPRLSRRNYICLGLRGTQLLGQRTDGHPAYTWGTNGQCDALIIGPPRGGACLGSAQHRLNCRAQREARGS